MDGLGTWLWAKGLKGRHIALIGENSYEWLAAFLAIVNGGCVAVPIDKSLPGKEIAGLLKKADVSAVFCSPGYWDVTSEITGADIFSLADIPQYAREGARALESGGRSFVEYEIDREKCCCIFFTSGTSGSSKGVALSQRNLAEEINNSCKLFCLDGDTAALLPFHHAFGLIVGVWMEFHYGYATYINKSLKTVKNALVQAHPQTLFLVPLFVETFHRQVWDAAEKAGKKKALRLLMRVSELLLKAGIDIRKKAFSSVREAFGGQLEYIISGGAALDSFYVREFRSWGIEIANGYGTTECSPCTAVNRNHYHRDGTVGLPIPGAQIKIAGDGEVLVRGGHVMMGYYKEPEETAKVLKDGWYATGDLGYLDGDGFLTLTGRKKNLIILSNGENVSPEELEAELLRDEAVQEVLVYEKERMIVAEIYPHEEFAGNMPYFERLREKANRDRPPYKRIAKILLRNQEFQKNSSMKIMRYKNIE